MTKYYFAGAQRVAMRTGSTLNYLLGDHLGSTSITVNTSGAFVAELRYKPFPLHYPSGVLRQGETRYTSGTTPTNYQYTGQRNETSLGLYFYNARWYDPYLNHFTQPDTIVPDPGNPQDWNRYSYARYNPIRYTDPSGHSADCGIGNGYGPNCTQTSSFWLDEITNNFDNITIKNPKDWIASEAQILFSTLDQTHIALGGNHDAFNAAFGNLTFEVVDDLGENIPSVADWGTGYIMLAHWGFQGSLDRRGAAGWSIAHEMGHILDYRWSGGNPKKYLSNIFVHMLNGGCAILTAYGCLGSSPGPYQPAWDHYGTTVGNYHPSDKDTTEYALAAGSIEDFADSFAAGIVGDPRDIISDNRELLIQITLDLIVSNYP